MYFSFVYQIIFCNSNKNIFGDKLFNKYKVYIFLAKLSRKLTVYQYFSNFRKFHFLISKLQLKFLLK